MLRSMYRAQWKPGQAEAGLSRWEKLVQSAQKLIDDGEIMTIAGYRWENQIFLYCEWTRHEWQPDHFFRS